MPAGDNNLDVSVSIDTQIAAEQVRQQAHQQMDEGLGSVGEQPRPAFDAQPVWGLDNPAFDYKDAWASDPAAEFAQEAAQRTARAARQPPPDRRPPIDRPARLSAIREYADTAEETDPRKWDEGRLDFLDERGLLSDAQSESLLVRKLRPEGGEHGGGLRGLLASMDGAYAIGYGVQATAAGLEKAWAPALSGEAYLPEQAAEQSATAFAPLAGALIGTGVGLKVGGAAGGLAGQYVGQAAGQGLEDVIDQYTAGHTFAQERAGESLGVGQGGKAAVDEFVDALKNAATPAAKELAETLTKLGQGGPLAAGNAAQSAGYFGGLQFSLGTAFADTVGGAERALASSPYSAGVNAQFLAGTASNQDLIGNAMVHAESGDFAGTRDLLGVAQAHNTDQAADPRYKRDRDGLAKWNGQNGVVRFLRALNPFDSGADQADAAEERLKTEGPSLPGQDPAAANKALWQQGVTAFEARAMTEAGTESAQATLGAGLAGLQTSVALGGGAAAYDKALPGLHTAASTGNAAIQKDLARLEALKSQFPGQAAQFQAIEDQQTQRDAEMQTQAAGVAQAGFRAHIGESVAGFALNSTSATYGADGKPAQSAAQMAGLYTGEEKALTGYAENSLADPALAAQLRTEAITLRVQHAQSQYGQEEGALAVTAARRSGSLVHAEQFGSTDQVHEAQQGQAQQELDTARQLSSELERGNLSYDQRIEKTREIVEHTARAAQIEEAATQTRVQVNLGVASENAATAQIGLDRRVEAGGNRAVPDSVWATETDELKAAQAKLAAAHNPQEKADAQHDVAEAQEAVRSTLDVANTYRPTGAVSRELTNAEGSFRRAQEMPYVDGPDSNPFQRGAAYLGLLEKDLGGLDANRRTQQGKGAWRDEDETHYTQQRNDLQDQIASLQHDRYANMFGALPEMTAGSPGQGVMSGVVPPAALTALFTPGPQFGNWGGPAADPFGGLTPKMPTGGAAGGFNDAHGLTGVENLLQQLVMLVRANGGTFGAQSSPVNRGGPAAYDQFLQGQH